VALDIEVHALEELDILHQLVKTSPTNELLYKHPL
jgi:hypothetical protein